MSEFNQMIKWSIACSYFLLSFGLTAQPTFISDYPDTLNKKRLASVIATESATYIGGMAALSFVWYKDHDRTPFHLYNDSKGYLQMDKAGHAYGAYRYSYAGYYALRWAGVPRKTALIFGGPLGLIFQTPIEVFDGLYEGYGFSWPDMAANTFGSALFTTQEALFNEQIVMMKFSYSPSGYEKYHRILGENPVEQFFLDYNGHTYWLSAGLRKITGIKKIPEWLNIAGGYSANGMIYEFENPTRYLNQPFPHLERYRQFALSLDVNFSKIPTKNKAVRLLLRAVNLIKIPFPALEYNRVDGLKARALYF